MMHTLYKKRKAISVFLLLVMVFQITGIPVAHALTAGPSQPEVQSFEPATTTEMVDLFSGDFVYNIPLFELPGPNGGYPFNLSYHAGVGMDTESSWCGLGWNLSPGAINRQMRGLPDEFDGDVVRTKMATKPSVTVGLGLGAGSEVFGANLPFGFGIRYNNYKGIGYSMDYSAGFGVSLGNERSIGAKIGLTLDSEEGAGVTPSLGLNTKYGTTSVMAMYHSRAGLHTLSLDQTWDHTCNKRYKIGGEVYEHTTSHPVSGGASLSLAHPGYTPQVSMPMNNISVSGILKSGAGTFGLFANKFLRGFYTEQWLKNNKKWHEANAYGYMNYQHSNDPKAMLDVNREKDGMVSQVTPNLGIPVQSYDIYSVTGQGIGAMYRPMRNDYGIIRDPEVVSTTSGGSFGIDYAPLFSHAGGNMQLQRSQSKSGGWTDDNQLSGSYAFTDTAKNSLHEPWYFKLHGEMSSESLVPLDEIGGLDPVRVKLADGAAVSALEKDGWNKTATANGAQRKQRSNMIQPVTNKQLLNAGGKEVLPQFIIKYRDANGELQTYNRTDAKKMHHVAGFTALTPEGLRYTYGIPAYNTKQEEVTFTARKDGAQPSRVKTGDNGHDEPRYEYTGTDKFLKRVQMPAYAHAYLLTSILGPDYVDVKGDGVTDDDLGYWVKFTYQQTTSETNQYGWRDPYTRAHFVDGWKSDPRDDKGSFVYGEKELWYLDRAETKSHVAVFVTEDRHDGRGAKRKLQDNVNANDLGAKMKALKEIRLYTRKGGAAAPIKTVRFDYDYSLCPGIENSDNGGGKLTLKSLSFLYGTSTRGELNPYEFTYHASNPSYDIHAYDRWGNYKPYPAGQFQYNHDFPYVDQNPDNKASLDANTASWNLTQVKLPSGGKVMIDYESDDYGYVQHKQAMQMMELVDPYTPSKNTLKTDFKIKQEDSRVRFKLEKPLSADTVELKRISGAAWKKQEVLKYLDRDRMQLFFKLWINLRGKKNTAYEYINCYADIDTVKAMGIEQDGSGKYVYGYFNVVKEKGYHPFSLRAWQHLRTNQPELANVGTNVEQTGKLKDRINLIRSLISLGGQVWEMFQSFNSYCKLNGWGQEMTGGKSWVRLNSPDKIKYGGGLRVKQITMADQWKYDDEGVYGQVYDYTIEEDGKTISSGVAAYEPVVGGEENALRYAKKYVESVPMRNDNNLFFEYPINESYYPGPDVGYRKVTVLSLAAASLAGKTVQHVTFPSGQGVTYGTTGMSVHEFYTAKDFPVRTYETEKANQTTRVSLTIPFMGKVSISQLTSTQGYSIITNDMHGKPKKVSNYRQDKAGHIEPEPISWVRYNYRTDTLTYEKENMLKLLNTFKENPDGTLSKLQGNGEESNASHFTLGEEREFVTDMRQFEDNAWEVGVNVNVDVVYFGFTGIPVTTVWPGASKDNTRLRTTCSNKVIFQSGILESTEAYDGGSMVRTENLKWDKLTGAPVLTVVNNNFDAPIYSYSIQAYTQYAGMGPASQNAGLVFKLTNITKDIYKDQHYSFSTPVGDNVLFEGDEIILYANNKAVVRAIYNGQKSGVKQLYSSVPLAASTYTGMIVRSGYRNQLTVAAGSLTGLSDPSAQGPAKSYNRTVRIPK